MTDKIMIDGVDVSRCEYFSAGLGYCKIGLWADDGTHICECEHNCYYKQLARKTKECEKLDIENKRLVGVIATDIFEKYEEFENELQAEQQKTEALDKQISLLKTRGTPPLLGILIAENEKYKQALEEIKPILEFYANSRMGVETKPGVFALKTEQGIILNYDSQPAREALQVYEEALKTDD